MSTTGLKISRKIEAFTNFVTEATSIYKYCVEMLHKCEGFECDIRHKLELKQYKDRNERARLHTQLENCFRDRRYYKDRIEELEPFVLLFEDTSKEKEQNTRANKSCLNAIKQSLGNVRKAESYHKERTYKPRVLKDMYGERDAE